jgi:hypothetical protein
MEFQFRPNNATAPASVDEVEYDAHHCWAEVETPSAKARWYLVRPRVVVRPNLKLHRLKRDGI